MHRLFAVATLLIAVPLAAQKNQKTLEVPVTPRKINALEPKVREFTARCLDPLVGGDRGLTS